MPRACVVTTESVRAYRRPGDGSWRAPTRRLWRGRIQEGTSRPVVDRGTAPLWWSTAAAAALLWWGELDITGSDRQSLWEA